MNIQRDLKSVAACAVAACAVIAIAPSAIHAQARDFEAKFMELYRPDTWPKSTQPPIMGLKFDDFRMDDFDLKSKRRHPATEGTDYWWHSALTNLDLHVVVNVYSSSDEARQRLFAWLQTGIMVPMQKGSFSGSTKIIGDISWVQPSSFTLAFIRDNTMVILYGITTASHHRQVIEKVATAIDETIRAEPRSGNAAETIKRLSPIIDTVTLEKTTLRVGDRIKISIAARDPRGGILEYSVRATGGNILKTKEGYLFQALTPGRQMITVLAISPYNLRSERQVAVTVEK